MSTLTAEQLRKTRYIPAGATEITDPQSSAVVYLLHPASDAATARNGAQIHAMGYSGRRRRSDFNYLFRSEAQLKEHREQFFKTVQSREQYRKQQRAARPNGRGLVKKGDILRATYGYDQTNNEFYEVTAVRSPCWIEMREIGSEYRETGWLCGYRKPTPGNYTGPALRKKLCTDGKSVKIQSWLWAHLLEDEERNREFYDSSYH